MDKKYIARMTGYKATRADMTCNPSNSGTFYQFILGEWAAEITEDLELCAKDYHFCVHPSGVWDYYNSPDTRVFKIEAENVLEIPIEAGASFKLVARRIRLVEEITPGLTGNDKSNTGDSNTGNRNTGDSNTGNRNTGYSNATNNSAGFFCQVEPKSICFDVQTDFTKDDFMKKYPEIWDLQNALLSSEKIDIQLYKNLPGITPEKLASLHAKHLAARA